MTVKIFAKYLFSQNTSLCQFKGAHASGFAGAELKSIQRITGLDPAGYNDIQLI